MRIAVLGMFALSLAPAANALVYSVSARDTQGLRQAILTANATPNADIIELEAGLYPISGALSGNLGLPAISGPLVIRGHGAEIRGYTRDRMTLLEVSKQGHLVLEGLTLAEGTNGALVNHGVAELRGVTIVDQTTRDAAAIVSNFGEMRLVNCELSFNTLSNTTQNAGTIVNYGFTAISHTHIQGNLVSRRYASLALASVLLNYGTAELNEVRLDDNEAIGNVSFLGHAASTHGTLVNQGAGTIKVIGLSESNNLPSLTGISP